MTRASDLSGFVSTSSPTTPVLPHAQEVDEKYDNPDRAKLEFEDTPLEDAENYFADDKFQPGKLAKDMVENIPVLTVIETNEVYVWDEGRYIGGPAGENHVLSMLKPILGGRLLEVSKHQKNEFVAHLRLWNLRHHAIFNTDAHLLPLRNGVLDINTRELGRYYHNRHFFLFQIPVNYDANADCPRFKQFVSEIVYPADIPVIQEMFGWCLWRGGYESLKKAIMLVGDGDNGKSLLLSVLREFLGRKNVSATALASLSENRFASAGLRGKLVNIHPDLPDRALRETGQFKGLTGGDLMPFEIKHGGSGEFINDAKLIFAANKLPDARDDTDAFFGRFIIINFPYQFVSGRPEYDENERPARDKNQLLSELTTPGELSGIHNWALEGLARLRGQGRFSNDMSIQEMRDKYERLANPIKAFVSDCYEIGTKDSDCISKDDFYREYVAYCRDRNLLPERKEKLGRLLPQYYPGQVIAGRDMIGGSRLTTWRGIKVREGADRR